MPPLADIRVEPLIIILVIVLVMLGGKKIPELLRGVGLGIGEIQNLSNHGWARENEAARIGQQRRLVDGLARRARMYIKALSRRIRTLLGLPKDDDDDDDDWFDGGLPPPPSAVQIWSHDESSEPSGGAAEPVASQYVGSSRER